MISQERYWHYRQGTPQNGRFVLYWMQQAQRTLANHALEWAVAQAAARQLPLVVVFALTDNFPEANARHYAFMLAGLRDVAAALAARGIHFVLRKGHPPAVVSELAKAAALLVGDVGYLRLQQAWRKEVARQISCPFTALETDVVIPVATASPKEEYAARTIRPKINRLLPRYLVPCQTVATVLPALDHPPATDLPLASALEDLDLDRTVSPSTFFQGGQNAAHHQLDRFVDSMLPRYHIDRNEPAEAVCSHMSPYLHFGQISPLEIALRVQAAKVPPEAEDAYGEELIVRRELSMNFVHYNAAYDTYAGAVPAWAQKTLDRHRADPREICYDRETLETARTGDPYWNAAQREMMITGKMHNYMRMYWGKKVIEWSPSPEQAFETLLYLNNKYEIDGRDANGFTGVAWCFGKHDRPWKERPVFGTVRYMAASGLKRKFDIDRYVAAIRDL